MANVKLIHILKHLELIDRDINELRHFGEELSNNRAYSDAIRISLELQINNLLNQRVSLMELKIDNPPESLKKVEKETGVHSMSGHKFSFQDHEEVYLPKLLNRQDVHTEKTQSQTDGISHDTHHQKPASTQVMVRKK